jgi:hypothetical protein
MYGAIITEDSNKQIYSDGYKPIQLEDGERYFVLENYDPDMSTPTKISELTDIDIIDLVADAANIRFTLYRAGVDADEANINGTFTDLVTAIVSLTRKPITVGSTGASITDAFFSNTITAIGTEGQFYLKDVHFTIDTGTETITGINGTTWSAGQKIIAYL